MIALREKIKTIIFNHGGLPGLNQNEYMDEMRKIITHELSHDDKDLLRKSNIRIESLILELTREIANEIL